MAGSWKNHDTKAKCMPSGTGARDTTTKRDRETAISRVFPEGHPSSIRSEQTSVLNSVQNRFSRCGLSHTRFELKRGQGAKTAKAFTTPPLVVEKTQASATNKAASERTRKGKNIALTQGVTTGENTHSVYHYYFIRYCQLLGSDYGLGRVSRRSAFGIALLQTRLDHVREENNRVALAHNLLLEMSLDSLHHVEGIMKAMPWEKSGETQ